MLGISEHPAVATMNAPSPAKSGTRRPNLSLSGPTSTWPSASRTRQVVSEAWVAEVSAFRSRLILGSAGRYMSMQSEPRAESGPVSRSIRSGLAVAIRRPSLALHCPADGPLDIRGARRHGVKEHRAVGHRRERGAQPEHRRVQFAEEAFLKRRGDLGSDAAVPVILGRHHQAPRPPHGFLDEIEVA